VRIDYDKRRRAVAEAMARQGLDLLAVGPSENMSYLLGFHPHADERPCMLLLTPKEAAFLMPELNADEARQHTDLPMETYADATGPAAALEQLARQLSFEGVRQVALDETMRTDFSLLLLASLPRATPTVAADVLTDFRSRKDEAEIDAVARNAAIADQAMDAAFAALRPGVSEKEVADVVHAAFKARGVDRVNFAIIGAGANGAFPHHATGATRMKEGDAVVLDIGAHKEMFNSDITRMAFVGEPTAEFLEVHGIVEQAVQAALAEVRPGARACDIDGAARRVIERAGYGERFVHRTGHGLGLTGHEPPYITSANEQTLDEGMVFSIEPGVYLPGKFGVRLEEIVVVTADGARVFSQVSREPHVVRVSPKGR
jgi:Xaa-Pro aminopeptidase